MPSSAAKFPRSCWKIFGTGWGKGKIINDFAKKAGKMASVNEQIVREYFETLGFFVIQPNKHQVAARHKLDAEEIDLLITRPGQAGVFSAPKEVARGAPSWRRCSGRLSASAAGIPTGSARRCSKKIPNFSALPNWR
jgi:hypothetical protein